MGNSVKIVYKVCVLEENEIVKDVWLSSNGIDKETEFIVVKQFQEQFDTEVEAINCAVDFAKHGYEAQIVKAFVPIK